MRGWIGVRGAALALTVTVAAACNETSGLPEQQADAQPGVLQLVGYNGPVPSSGSVTEGRGDLRWSEDPGEGEVAPPQVIDAPESVAAGTPFDITTYTFGSGCTAADGQEVNVTGNVVELTPYDVELGQICTMILKLVPHTSTLTLDSPGEWVIRVSGRKVRYGDDTWELPITAETTIIVE